MSLLQRWFFWLTSKLPLPPSLPLSLSLARFLLFDARVHSWNFRPFFVSSSSHLSVLALRCDCDDATATSMLCVVVCHSIQAAKAFEKRYMQSTHVALSLSLPLPLSACLCVCDHAFLVRAMQMQWSVMQSRRQRGFPLSALCRSLSDCVSICVCVWECVGVSFVRALLSHKFMCSQCCGWQGCKSVVKC